MWSMVGGLFGLMSNKSPVNTERWINVVLMLDQRRRWWPNIETTLFRRSVFAGHRSIEQHLPGYRILARAVMCHDHDRPVLGQVSLTWARVQANEMKWNESGFRPPLCTYRLNWARSTSWGWWDDWDDTVLQTQDSKFEPWRSEAEHATSRSRRLPTILTFTRGWGRNIFVSFKPPRPGTEPRTLAWKAAVLTTTLGPPPTCASKLSEDNILEFQMQYSVT